MNEELELHEIEGSASPDDGTAVEALDSFCSKNGASDLERLDRVKFPTARKALFHCWSKNKSRHFPIRKRETYF